MRAWGESRNEVNNTPQESASEIETAIAVAKAREAAHVWYAKAEKKVTLVMELPPEAKPPAPRVSLSPDADVESLIPSVVIPSSPEPAPQSRSPSNQACFDRDSCKSRSPRSSRQRSPESASPISARSRGERKDNDMNVHERLERLVAFKNPNTKKKFRPMYGECTHPPPPPPPPLPPPHRAQSTWRSTSYIPPPPPPAAPRNMAPMGRSYSGDWIPPSPPPPIRSSGAKRGRSRGKRSRSRGKRSRSRAVRLKSKESSRRGRSSSPLRRRSNVTRNETVYSNAYEIPGNNVFGLQNDMVRRPAIGRSTTNSSMLNDCDDGDPIAPTQGNFMITNWVIGKTSDPEQVAYKIKVAPFDCIVFVMAPAVAESDPILKFFNGISKSPSNWDDELFTPVLREKAVFRLTARIFYALHRAKVKGGCTRAWASNDHTAVAENSSRITFITLQLSLCTTHQVWKEMSIGIVYMPKGVVYRSDRDALVSWILRDKLGMMTGFFGCDDACSFVKDVAQGAHAISDYPLFQGLHVPKHTYPWLSSRTGHDVTYPNYFVIFGRYRAISVKQQFADVPETFSFATDIMEHMIETQQIPDWPWNPHGSHAMHHFGHLKMLDVNWKHWISTVFQTCIWVGSSIPSKSSQRKWVGKGKSAGKGKSKQRQ